MKILLAHNRYTIVGGAEVFYFEVGRVLEERGHEVAYFSADNGNIPDSLKWKKYFPKYKSHAEGNFISRIFRIKDMIYSTKAKDNFSALISDFQPDIIHVFAASTSLTPSILDASKEAKIPVVMSLNEYKHICPSYKLFHHGKLCEDCKGGHFYKATINRCAKNSLVYSVASTLEAYVHNWLNIYKKNVDLFLFSSEFMAKKTEEFWGKNTFFWDILQNPFESKKYALTKEYEDYILYFGRLIDEKGVDVLVNAMKLVPDVNLKIIGTGPDEEMLMELSQELQLKNIEFLGPKWGDELNEVLKLARFVIVPSIWHENFPYVILQSFAFGKAVIGTDRGGIPELVRENEYGYIYPADNHKALAKKIKHLWHNPDLAISMGSSAKQFIDINFNDKKFYENIIRIYQKVLK